MKKLLLIFLLFAVIKTRGQNRYADSITEKIKSAKEDTAKVRLLYGLAYHYIWSSADSSLLFGQRALQLSQKINDQTGIAHSQQTLCRAFTTIGNYPQALNYGFKAQAFYKKIKDTLDIIRSDSDIGLCYREEGNYKIALSYFSNAFMLSKLFHISKTRMNNLYGMISSVYEKSNQLDSALYYAQKAHKVDTQWSGLLYVLGSIYTKKGDNELAVQYFKKTVSVAEKTHAQIDIVDSYNGMARVYINEGKTDSAIYYVRKAIGQKWGKSYPKAILESSALLAGIYERKKISDSTLKYLKLTITLKDSLFSRQKEREIQNIAFNDQLSQQELIKQQERAQNRLKMYALLTGLFVFLILVLLQWRNNRHRQRAYRLLQQQKQETDVQKAKVEHTLDELKLTQQQLIQSEKMASLGELTAGIAHEIQNPLNFVNNFAEVSIELLDEMETELKSGDKEEALSIASDVKQNLEKIRHHGQRADGIVKGMLQHSRASSNTKEPTDVNKLADEYLRLAYHGLRAKDKNFNAELETNFDPKLPLVSLVPQDIGRVLLNLFTNAFYATEQKKKLAAGNYSPVVKVSTAKIGDNLEIKVRDNGNGIADDIKDKIMQPFFTTKPTGEGTGLGLSMSYDIVVKGHGGSIQVESKEGGFTEFIIQIPV